MAQIDPTQLREILPNRYTYQSRLEGDESGGFVGFQYPHGEGWVGREIGQRTLPFSNLFPTIEASVNIDRDIFIPTQEETLERLSNRDLGFPALPTWMSGSGRTYIQGTNGAQFPDSVSWHAVADLMYLGDATPLLKSGRLSLDPSLGIDTGPAIPRVRQLYWLDSNFDPNAVTGDLVCNGVSIRRASSYWDFSTSFDPIYLQVEDDSGIVFRNLSPTVTLSINVPVSGIPLAQYELTTSWVSGCIGPYLEDEEAVFMWSGGKSLSDSIYIPTARTLGTMPAGYDVSAGLVGREGIPSGLIQAFNIEVFGPGYPVPSDFYLLSGTSKAPLNWGSSQYPFGISTPASGTTYALFHLPPDSSYTISMVSGGTIGIAYPIDARNGWDRSGQFIGLGRRSGETDIRYGGRQQRSWITGIMDYTSGSEQRTVRVLSSALGRSFLIEKWQGESFPLPADTTAIDLVSYDPNSFISLSLINKDLLPLSSLPVNSSPVASGYTDRYDLGAFKTLSTDSYITYASGNVTMDRVFKCREDLSTYDFIKITLNNQTLMPGRDYLISIEDPTVIIFHNGIPLVNTSLELTLSRRSRMRAKLQGDNSEDSVFSNWRATRSTWDINTETLPSLYKRFIASKQLPLLNSGSQFPTNETSTAFPVQTIVSDSPPGSDFYTPAVISRGPQVKSLTRIADRRLFTPGRLFPTALGQGILESNTSRPTWSEQIMDQNAPIVSGILTDLEEPPYIP